MITEQTFTEVAYVRHWEQNTIHLARGERRWGRVGEGGHVDGGALVMRSHVAKHSHARRIA